ncbi:unnamed protein product [Arctia plantaginis]|uniref:Uncharacterized protein n=1 Tax=Arctia plantaginis TaxID=874455 RepID=A0A8S0ZB38_ARCPL|nr:unnamed protein product [Arctia plantaginis]
MNYNLVLVLCLHVTSIHSVPMRMQLMPLQYGMQQQNPLLQIQNPFFRQAANNFQPPFMYPQQPIILLLPNLAPNAEIDDRYTKLNEEENRNKLKANTGHIDEKKDAVILDADYNSEETDSKQAMMFMPNDPRFSIGSIISLIPFLPIEINVPDTINWISTLLPGWFGRPGQKPENSMRLSSKGPLPILVLPAPMMTQI